MDNYEIEWNEIQLFLNLQCLYYMIRNTFDTAYMGS